MAESLDQTLEDWQWIHEHEGCFGCKYADKTQLGKGPCCTYPGRIIFSHNDESQCAQRKEA